MIKLPVERRGESLYCAVQDVFQISHFSFPGFAQLAILLKRNEDKRITDQRCRKEKRKKRNAENGRAEMGAQHRVAGKQEFGKQEYR